MSKPTLPTRYEPELATLVKLPPIGRAAFEAAAISYAADVGATGCSVAPGGARPLIWAALLICLGLRRQRRRELRIGR